LNVQKRTLDIDTIYLSTLKLYFMSTNAVIKRNESFPTLFDEFFKPWDPWFGSGGSLWSKPLTMPSVNIAENKDDYKIAVAAPGLKKSDFNIDIEGNMLTISCEKEEKKDEKDARHTRREYNYSSFSRSFTLPDEVMKEKIEAVYEDGVLNLTLPKKEEAKKLALSKHIAVK
jgi:HSP20 family protein